MQTERSCSALLCSTLVRRCVNAWCWSYICSTPDADFFGDFFGSERLEFFKDWKKKMKPSSFTFALEFGESDRWGWWSFIEFIFHLKNRSCRSPPVAGWNLYALVRYSCHVKGRYTCGLSSVMSSWGASTVALKGGFKKQARDRRFENPFTAALCKTLLYLVLLRTCKSENNHHRS